MTTIWCNSSWVHMKMSAMSVLLVHALATLWGRLCQSDIHGKDPRLCFKNKYHICVCPSVCGLGWNRTVPNCHEADGCVLMTQVTMVVCGCFWTLDVDFIYSLHRCVHVYFILFYTIYILYLHIQVVRFPIIYMFFFTDLFSFYLTLTDLIWVVLSVWW